MERGRECGVEKAEKYRMQRLPVNFHAFLAILAAPFPGLYSVLFFPVSGIFRR
jgi:hypothetical protein